MFFTGFRLPEFNDIRVGRRPLLGPPVRPQFLNSVDTTRHHVTRERRPPFPCDTIEDATSSSLIPHGAMIWHVVWCALDSVLSGCMWEDLCGPVPNHRAKCELRKRQFGVRWTACYPAAFGRIYVSLVKSVQYSCGCVLLSVVCAQIVKVVHVNVHVTCACFAR